MANTPTPHAGQLADAFNAVPGVGIEMLSHVPSGTFAAGPISFADINAEFEYTFNVPVAGKYLILFSADVYFSVGGSSMRYRLVFDAAGTPQYIGNDDNTWNWQQTTTSNREYRSVFATVELTAGSHTVKPQWKRTSGSGNLNVTAGSGMMVWGHLLSGSGASGTLVDTKQLVANFTPSVTSTWEDVDNGGGDELTNTVDVAANEQVFLVFQGRVDRGGAVSFFQVRITLDGTPIDTPATAHSNDYSSSNMSFSRMSPALTAGPHTFKVQLYHQNATGYMYGGSVFQVVRLRGGQVPIEQAGVEKTATPRAQNYSGHLVQVDGTGKANIAGQIVEEQATTPKTLDATTDNGKLFTNEGAGAEIGFTLPAAAAGLMFKFITQDITQRIRVNAVSGDSIRVGGNVSGDAGNILSTSRGDTMTLVATNTAEWIALSYIGAWTVT